MRDPSPHGEWADTCPECGLYTWHCICRDTGWEDVDGWDEREEDREGRITNEGDFYGDVS